VANGGKLPGQKDWVSLCQEYIAAVTL
jgi:hypothetical protein